MRTLFMFFWLLLSFSPIYAVDPLTPQEAVKSFQLASGWTISLAAAEPDVIDPVAACFDAQGRLFVCEMTGYPNGGLGTGEEKRGRIRLLVDKNGDGKFDESKIFAEGLRFPTGIVPWKKGFIVANAPEIIYLEDTNNDDKADVRKTLYTGFAIQNIQQLVNSLQWGPDGWIYACAGGGGGDIKSAEKPDAPAVILRGRGIRFKPEIPASLEPTSGGGQYGLTRDPYGHWFTSTNSQHLRQIVLPDHYLRKNPLFSPPAVTSDIPEHGPACEVFRTSPFEAWRVERTTRRKEGPDAGRFAKTELFAGGFSTSSCSPHMLQSGAIPDHWRGRAILICEPANNSIMMDVLYEGRGGAYVAKRAFEKKEFLTSKDNWCRPVWLVDGPDNALYMLDFYREVIETPLSLPEDIKKKLILESRQRGRIWRIAPEKMVAKPKRNFDKIKPEQLVEALASDNVWEWETARRILRENPMDIQQSVRLLLNHDDPITRARSLDILAEFTWLKAEDIRKAAIDPVAGVRIVAARYAPRVIKNEALVPTLIHLADDPSPLVRFQLTLSTLEMEGDVNEFLTRVLANSANETFQNAAIQLAMKGDISVLLFDQLKKLKDKKTAPSYSEIQLVKLFGTQLVNQRKFPNLKSILELILEYPPLAESLLEGLIEGSSKSAVPVNSWWKKPTPDQNLILGSIDSLLRAQEKIYSSPTTPPLQKIAAVRRFSLASFETVKAHLNDALDLRHPPELTLVGLRTLGSFAEPEATEMILNSLSQFGPNLKREALEILTDRPARIHQLLKAIESKQLSPTQLDSVKVKFLIAHPNNEVRQKAMKILGDIKSGDRQKIVQDYNESLKLKGDALKGKKIFATHCATCHRYENVGHTVGPEFAAVLKTKTRPAILHDIFDPNKEVDSRYVVYQVVTHSGKTITGILTIDAATSITLRRGDAAEDTIPREQIESLRATNVSLMPEGLEKQISKQDLADLLEYLLPEKSP